MGLDSYFYRSLTANESERAKQALAPVEDTLTATGEEKGRQADNTAIPAYLIISPGLQLALTPIAHWRKSYHVHQWFVDNVQDGENEGGYYRVQKDDLEKLHGLLEQLNRDNAIELLENYEEYDDDYDWDDIDMVKQMMEYLLHHFQWEECHLYYSSWL